MQIDKLFTAIWHDTTTGPGTPLTGLSATITIRDKDTNIIVVNNQAMIEIGLGEYDYTFNAMVSTKAYSYVMNPNSTSAYVVSGYVDPRMANMDGAITDIRGGGGFSVNLSGVTGSITNLQKALTKKIEDIPKIDFNEIHSHIDIAKDEVLNKIDAVEIPEAILEEKEAKKALKLLTTLDSKVTSYIESEINEKEEIGAIASELLKIDLEDEKKAKEEKRKEEDEKKRKEEEHKKMIEEQAKMLELEFDKLDKQEQEDKKKELEKELEETIKEAEEIKKELKSL